MIKTINDLITELKKLAEQVGNDAEVWLGVEDRLYCHMQLDITSDSFGKKDAVHIQLLDEDSCPVCGEEIEAFDNGDGTFAIFCPRCGPIDELGLVTEFSESHYLGWPKHHERWCPDDLTLLEIEVVNGISRYECPQCGIQWNRSDSEIEFMIGG
jgi:predicted RNA-binding Zn-ribbon protein involved in translation (DUF1610 family)